MQREIFQAYLIFYRFTSIPKTENHHIDINMKLTFGHTNL